MRFLHTSDWHLGRIFHDARLLEDQAHILDDIAALVRDTRPDFFVLAGDVFDRAVPPAEAISLFDDFLHRMALDYRVPCLVLAGNHDHPQRLEFGSRFLKSHGLHLFGSVRTPVERLVFADGDGPVEVFLVPYLDPPSLRQCLGRGDIHTHEEAWTCLLETLPRPAGRSVLVGHALVVGGEECESERPLSVGGTGAIPPRLFAGFDYVALGHLHRAQSLAFEGRALAHYSGSPLKYSFSEVGQEKSLNLVEMDGQGRCRVMRMALKPRRDLLRLEGTLEALLDRGRKGPRSEDYYEMVLTDIGPLLHPLERLRAFYPHILRLERPYLQAPGSWAPAERRSLSDAELFQSFYRQSLGRELEPAALALLHRLLEESRSP